MNLIMNRKWHTDAAVIGELLVDGKFLCYTLEDPDEAGDRIPKGSYTVVIDYSNRFKKAMPHILGPGLEKRGIRIHKGNTQVDTIGCVLVGMGRLTDQIWNCEHAFNAVMQLLSLQASTPLTIRE